MRWQIVWSSPARRDMTRLDRPVAARIHEAMHKLAQTGHGDVKPLQGLNEYRLRVGTWRVRFTYDTPEAVITVVRVLPRGEAYRR